MDFIKEIINSEIRELVSRIYNLDKVDLMTIDLLSKYAFLLHDDIHDLTDDEINDARKFAITFLKSSNKWLEYNDKFKIFVNNHNFKSINNYDYKLLEKELYDKVLELNNLVNNYDWSFDIYFNADYDNKLFLSRINNNEYNNKINLSYDYKNKTFSKCDITLSDEMEKLGNIHYNYYDYDEIELDKINI